MARVGVVLTLLGERVRLDRSEARLLADELRLAELEDAETLPDRIELALTASEDAELPLFPAEFEEVADALERLRATGQWTDSLESLADVIGD